MVIGKKFSILYVLVFLVKKTVRGILLYGFLMQSFVQLLP